MNKIIKSRHKRSPVGTTGMSKKTKAAFKRQFKKEKVQRQRISHEIKVTFIYTCVYIVIGAFFWFYWR